MPRGYRRYLSKDRRLNGRRKGISGQNLRIGGQNSAIGYAKNGRQKTSSNAEINTAHRAQGDNESAHKQERPPSTRGEIIITFFTGILTLVGILAAAATYLQWDAANKALAFARDSANSSAADTQAALNISDRLAVAAEKQAREAQAYVANTRDVADTAKLSLTASRQAEVSFFSDTLNLTAGEKPTVILHLNNTGQRTIYDANVSALMRTGPRRDDIALKTDIAQNFDSAPTTVSAGEGFATSVDAVAAINQEAIDALRADKIRMYIFGKATYSDKNGPHTRYVCVAFYGTHIPLGTTCATKPDS
jgi:hypothetical protein